jgi:hypothetical protein
MALKNSSPAEAGLGNWLHTKCRIPNSRPFRPLMSNFIDLVARL